ncbi:hypothetical protein ACIBBB_31745 [Streptomyces sp. NPDC051217]|uniref:hypothetical protein n=1 Tax=Streptomyces sp. NPDC051217 TaxID=3365644 RepID=UPI003792702A
MTRRTRTTAVLLLGVAVGGVSACVAVEPEAGTGVGAVREAPPRRTVAPRIVQPPAREALEAAAPLARTPPPKLQATSAAVRPPPEPPRRRAAVQRSAPTTARPAPAPPTALPDTGGELCALGERYGGWKPDSPESRLCEETYGD